MWPELDWLPEAQRVHVSNAISVVLPALNVIPDEGSQMYSCIISTLKNHLGFFYQIFSQLCKNKNSWSIFNIQMELIMSTCFPVSVKH